MSNRRIINGRIEAMLGHSFYKIGEAENTITRLFRRVLMNRRIGLGDWSRLMSKYRSKHTERTRTGKMDEAFDKSNLTKFLATNKMSWENFHRALCFLDITKYSVSISITWRNGTVSDHTETVIIQDETSAHQFIKDIEDEV